MELRRLTLLWNPEPPLRLACACSPAFPHCDHPFDRLRCLGLARVPPFFSHLFPHPHRRRHRHYRRHFRIRRRFRRR